MLITMKNTSFRAFVLAQAATIAEQMSDNIRVIEESKNQINRLLSKLPAEYRPNMSDVIVGADQAISEARQRLDRYQSLIA
jgi:hypothetical protein|uniref:Uncharacterized protein n=1 Tax=Siphoviridae sp. ctxdc10 TaxID=2825740 RepID=A0A8S5TSD7_9CAUD|nr:MAG TPA: hypothetical protein [Siphoviridae sp. ctxdc10]DAU60183.1 MAG TPA: hypothetical protein [Caudoviricetes sp.]